jgi:hypothetical protein
MASSDAVSDLFVASWQDQVGSSDQQPRSPVDQQKNHEFPRRLTFKPISLPPPSQARSSTGRRTSLTIRVINSLASFGDWRLSSRMFLTSFKRRRVYRSIDVRDAGSNAGAGIAEGDAACWTDVANSTIRLWKTIRIAFRKD